MESMFQKVLNLPHVRVLEVSQTDRGEWILRVESTLSSTSCKHCGREISQFHGLGQRIRLRHLPIFEQPVFIEIRPKRYRCPHCEGGPTSTQTLDWYDERSPNTRAFEQWALRLLVNSTLADTAAKLGLTEELVDGILERWIERKVDWSNYERLGVIGIDEIALKRGHRDFVVLVTMQKAGGGVEILAVLKDRKKETVAEFLRTIPQRLRASITRVCSDMYEGFVNAAQEEVPSASVVIDRFHVARAYRDCFEQVRKKELRRLKQELGSEEYADITGAMWPLRKRPADLKDEEWALLERVFGESEKLEAAYNLREDLTELFDQEYTKAGAKRALRAWMKRAEASGIAEYESFLGTLERWMDEITNYFVDRQTSGFVEGFNNRVKVLKRRCYGIFDPGRLFQRIWLDLHGYSRFAGPADTQHLGAST